MTREEAIKIIDCYDINFYDLSGEKIPANKLVEAFDMAIEALKAEPIRCGECENYIDGRCIEANHHVAAHGNCMGVFGAKRREP